MTDFQKKLPLYKTAYSPNLGVYVGIANVFFNEDWDEWCIQARPAGDTRLFTFTPDELTNYCL